MHILQSRHLLPRLAHAEGRGRRVRHEAHENGDAGDRRRRQRRRDDTEGAYRRGDIGSRRAAGCLRFGLLDSAV